MINIYMTGFRLLMNCIMETKKENEIEPNRGVSTDCNVDCWGEIFISLGVGVLVGAAVVVGARIAVR